MSSATPPPSYPPGGPGGPPPPSGGGPGGPGYPSYPSGAGHPGGAGAKGFFGSLFDFSFNSFVTPRIVKFVYVLATLVIGMILLFWIIAAFATRSAALGILVLIIAPIIALLYLALIRMTLEFYYSVVRMSEDIHHRMPGR